MGGGKPLNVCVKSGLAGPMHSPYLHLSKILMNASSNLTYPTLIRGHFLLRIARDQKARSRRGV